MSVYSQDENLIFAERLKQERLKHNLTQQKLADLCGFGINQISRYESGDREPSLKALYKLAEVLRVSTDYLVGLTNNFQETIAPSSLGPYEREILDTFHKEGWAGIIHLGAERLAK